MTSPYSTVHLSPKGPGDARPTASKIIDDEALEGGLVGKVIFITGCSSGLGIETARALFRTGATLYLTARDIQKAKSALSDIAENERVRLLHLDLNSLESVRACAREFNSQSKQLNILIENAGVMACPEGRTADGFELQFGTNHLAHFLLFQLLKPTLLSSSTPSFNSRVVIVSSSAHRLSTVHLDNLNLEGEYEPWKSYGQSKTANIWTANEIERRWGAQGLHAFSLHPGVIATELVRHIPTEHLAEWAKDKDMVNYFKSPEQGCATTVWGAVAKSLEGKGGLYLDDCQIAKEYVPTPNHQGPGYESWAYDAENARKLWDESLKLVKLPSDL